MSDPLTISASVVGVVIPALHGTRLLLDDIKKIIDAPKVLGNLEEDLSSLAATLLSLQAIQETEWTLLGDNIAAQSQTTVRTCGRACEIFRSDLQRWTKRSRDGKSSFRDRAKIGFFKDSQISAISQHLQSCKLTCSNVVTMATLYSSIRNTHITQDVKDAIAKQEADITALSSSTASHLADVELSLKKMNLINEDEEDENERDDLSGAITQLEAELAALQASQALLPGLLAQVKREEIEKVARQKMCTNISFGNSNTGFQMGVNHGDISGISFGR